MIGTSDQPLIRRPTSTPSMSGRYRSGTTPPAVGLDDRLADRQPDPARPASLASPKRLEDARALVVGQPDALVGDVHLDQIGGGYGPEPYRRARRRVPGRVLEQVRQHLVQL